MRDLPIPSELAASQREVLSRVRAKEHDGSVAHVRVLTAQSDDGWRPVCGRVDLARTADAPIVRSRPVGCLRLLTETLPLADLADRLDAAFRGDPFLVAGEQVLGHGMDSAWQGERRTNDWSNFTVPWPCVSLAPKNGVARRVLLHEVIEGEGEIEAFDGSNDCVRAVMEYVATSRHGTDVRFDRFVVVEWDYRGRVLPNREGESLSLRVDPAGDPRLTLATVVSDTANRHPRRWAAPSEHVVKLTGELRRVTATLRHESEIVCEMDWSAAFEAAMWQDGIRPSVSLLSQKKSAEDVPTAAQVLLSFISDQKLALMMARDLCEMDAARSANAFKAAVLLAGSILEAALLDVLGRNQAVAQARLGRKWPEKASLTDLIGAAAAIAVRMPDGSTPALLPQLTGQKGAVVTHHRDLIHPRAEVRGAATIDEHTASTMRGVLGEVLRDLLEADQRGLLAEYGNGNVV